MYLTSPLHLSTQLGGLIISLTALLLALRVAPWKELSAKAVRQHLWLGSIVVMTLIWLGLSIRVNNDIVFHLMFIATLCFFFGAHLTMVSSSIALLAAQTIAGAPLLSWGVNVVLSILIPLLTTVTILRLIERLHYQNLFVYMLGGGFFGSILGVITTGGIGYGLLLLCEPDIAERVAPHMASFFVMIFPEGFCNGAIISTTTVLSPHLLRTYDDDFYLRKNDKN